MKKIKLYVDGNKTIARMDGKVGVAKCSPEDEFDIFVGAKLALERLEEKCKSYSWLKKGMDYFVPNINSEELYVIYTYKGYKMDSEMKDRGLAFKTQEEAVEAAKKMLAVLKNEADM